MSTINRPAVMLQLFVLVLTFNNILAQPQYGILGLFEGQNCKLPNGAQGACSKIKDCPSELNRLRQRQQNHRPNPVICSFTSARPDALPIICCEKTGQNIRGNAGVSGNNRPTPGRPTGAGANGTPQVRPPNTSNVRPPVVRPPVARPPVVRPPGSGPARSNGTPQVRPTPMSLGTRLNGVGAKSRKACEDLSNEVRPSIIPLIHGGANTIKGEFPHMALIGYRAIDNNAILWNCGGALISKRYVLTAAHCLVTRRRQHGPATRVRLGEFDLTKSNDGEIDFGIETALPHPEYSANSWYNDIALVRLDRNVVYSTFVLPACLHTESEDPTGGLIITGWGATSHLGDTKSSILQKGNRTLTLVPASTCESTYFEQGARNRLSLGVSSGMFCAVDPAGIVDTCQGDSGGPIQVERDIGHATIHVIVGVTSVGPSLCGGSTPAIYTRVYNYLNWIEATVWP